MNESQSIFSKYRKIILAVIIFVVCDLMVIGINFYGTFKAQEAAVSINLSGRQRMLSQRMTKVLLLIRRSVDTNDEPSVLRNLKELDLTVNLFNTTLRGFRDGAMVTGGDGNPVFLVQVETPKSHQLVADAYKIWDPYFNLLQPLLGNNRHFSAEQLESVVTYAQNNNLEVLRLMNDLTTDLEFVANGRADFLRMVLLAGFIIALINFSYTVFISIRQLMATDRELAQARGETIEILSTVHEGLFLLDKEKRLGSQFSESLPRLLHREIEPGMNFLPILKDMISAETYESAVDYIELLLGDRVKEALVTSLNPLTNVSVSLSDSIGNTQNRYLSFFFNRVLIDDKISHVLVTVQDVTDKIELMQQAEQAKNQAKTEVDTLLRLAGNDFGSLQQFVFNVGQSLGQINEKLSEPIDDPRSRQHTLNYIMRLVHGIKGEAAVLGIDAIEGYAHSCEQEMVAMREGNTELSGEHMVRIAVLLEGFYSRYSSLNNIVSNLSAAMGGQEKIAAAAQADRPAEVALPFVEHITHLAQRIASDRGKQVEVNCQVAKFAILPANITKELESISIQLVRNALTHGIESPEERATLNKPQTGALCLFCEYLGNNLYDFTVRDDGRGIVPDRLRDQLVKSGRMTVQEAATMDNLEVTRMIFQPGFSTASDSADINAGHGVGLDAVLEKVKGMNGRLSVKSRPDLFTEFHIQFSVPQ
ncbi:MAG: Hpt domain-containing protein [Azoarcus sp.]|jgi:signal transduction histidine kinase|nr:Hpt domain-containing protein [Azoarcus sp.]